MPTGRKFSFNGGRLLDEITVASVQYTEPFAVSRAVEWAVHLIYSGTPTVAVVLQATCIPNPDTTDDVDWVDDGDVTFAGVSAAAGKELVEVGNSGASLYRLKLTSSGTGTCSCWFSQKPRS